MCTACSQFNDTPGIVPGHHVQYVADNAEHNVRTLDGSGAFYGLGIITAITPVIKQERLVLRLSVTARNVAVIGKINICYFNKPPSDILSISCKTWTFIEKLHDTFVHQDLGGKA